VEERQAYLPLFRRREAAAAVMQRENADASDITYQELCAALRSIGAIVPEASS
jgi:hypothetical protein